MRAAEHVIDRGSHDGPDDRADVTPGRGQDDRPDLGGVADRAARGGHSPSDDVAADAQRGAATVLVLALAAVVTLVAAVCVAVGSVAVARHRAAAAADLVALAVAARVLEGPGAACARGASVAQAQGAALVSCRSSGEVVDVVVEVRPGGPLAELGTATGTARAGPGQPAPLP